MVNKGKFATVSIVEFKDFYSSLKESLDLIGFPHFFTLEGKSVLLKPNLTTGAPANSGGTTDVRLVEALVRILLEHRSCRVVVGESAGSEIRTDIAFDKLGYREMAERMGIQLLDFDHYPFRKIQVKNGLYQGVIEITEAMWDFDIYISIPCLKPHPTSGITVAYKNAYGVISDPSKITIHRKDALEEAMVDINSVRGPDLVVVDGIIGAEGVAGGTDFSHPLSANLILCGTDALAIDVISAYLMMQNSNISYIKWAKERNMGIAQLDHIEIKGLPLHKARRKFMSPLEQLEADFDNLTILDCGASTRCRAAICNTLLKLGPRSLTKKVTIVCSGNLTRVGTPDQVLLIGKDAGSCDLSSVCIESCPSASDLMEVMRKNNMLCQKCDRVIEEALSEFSQGELENINIVAEGRIIHKGQKDKGRLFVGDCTKSYYRMDQRRSEKSKFFRTGFDRISEYVPGCPPTSYRIRKSLKFLGQRLSSLTDGRKENKHIANTLRWLFKLP